MAAEQINIPKVRVAPIIFRDGKVVIAKMGPGSEEGTWMFPHSELKQGETYYTTIFTNLHYTLGWQCRSLILPDKYPIAATIDVLPDEHFVTLFMRAKYRDGNLFYRDKEKYKAFEWHPWDNLPKPRSQSIENLLEQNIKLFD